MTDKRTWDEFREAGLLWWVNRALHIFGWALVVEVDGEGQVTNCYPARCRFRGFAEDSEVRGFRKLSKHLHENSARLVDDANLEPDLGGHK